jgi:phosphohistidine phosphatase SixA
MIAFLEKAAAWLHVHLRHAFGALLSLSLVHPATAISLSDALESPNHVLLMRHADAPGIGDPADYDLRNCATQRNLGDLGKRQTMQTGDWLRAQGVKSARVYASPWCRCIDTGTLLNFGDVTIENSLGSFFDDPDRSTEQTARLEKFVAAAASTKGRNALILVTHQVNITAYVGQTIASGDMVLARIDRRGKVVSHRRYPSPSNDLAHGLRR